MASNWSTHLVLGFVFLDLVKCLLCFQFIKVACVICEAIIDQLDQKLTPKRKADSPSGDDEEKKWRGYDLSSIHCCSIFFPLRHKGSSMNFGMPHRCWVIT